jgi:hypothetical protein
LEAGVWSVDGHDEQTNVVGMVVIDIVIGPDAV